MVKTTVAILVLLVAALLSSSCAHDPSQIARQSNRWLLTPADIKLLEAQHARPYPQRRAGLDGREITELCADDYFDDRGMRLAAEKMPDLQALSLLSCSRVTDAGMRHIVVLSQLKRLWIDRTSITDRGVQQILQLKNLEALNVSGTAVTASGLATLVLLPKLKFIDASEIAFSAAEKAMLQQVFGRAINFD